MFAYGQVKGRKYDDRQPEYVPPTPEPVVVSQHSGGRRKHPVICDGKRFESVAACAREFDCQPSTIRYHLERGTQFRGHTLVWEIGEDNG